MVAYFILILVPLLYSIVVGAKHKYGQKRKGVLTLFFAVMLIILVLREKTVGIDLIAYENILHNLDYYKVEIGYTLVCKLILLLGGDIRLLIIVAALISLIPIWILYRNECGEPWLAIGLFLFLLFNMYFSALRQVMAMAFIVPAFYFTKEKKPVKFLICVLLAFLFHKSSLITIMLYPVYNIRFNKWMLLGIIPVIIFLLVFNERIFTLMMQIIGGEYSEKYGIATADTGAYGSLILLVVLAIYCFILPRESEVDSETAGLRNVLLLSVLIQCFAPIHTLVMRLNYYFLMFVPILVSRVAMIGRSKDRLISELSMLIIPIVFVIYFFIAGFMGSDPLQIFPYVSILG